MKFILILAFNPNYVNSKDLVGLERDMMIRGVVTLFIPHLDPTGSPIYEVCLIERNKE